MVTLVAAPQPPAQDEVRTGWLVATGAAAAALAAAVGLAMLSAITVLLWALGPHTTENLTAAPFRGAASLWLMAQWAPVDTSAGELRLAPLALTAGVAALTARVAGWAVRRTRAYEVRPALGVVGGVVAGHVVLAGAAAAFSSGGGSGASGVDVTDAARAAVMFAVPCALAGLAPNTWIWARVAARYGAAIRTGVRAAGAGALVLLGGGAAVIVVSLMLHHGSFREVLDAVGGGLSGNVGMLLLCVALLPNAALWVVAFAAGPGFGLGTGAGLDLGGLQDGAVPALPLLAALPAPGPLAVVAFMPLALPAVAGAVIGWLARDPAARRRARSELALAGLAALLCGLGIGVLAALSGGGVGGRLSEFGPTGIAVGAATAVELSACALLVAGARVTYERFQAPAPAPVKQLTAASAPPAATAGREDRKDIEDTQDTQDTQDTPVVADADPDPGPPDATAADDEGADERDD